MPIVGIVTTQTQTPGEADDSAFDEPQVFTWSSSSYSSSSSADGARMEQARIVPGAEGLFVRGRLIEAGTAERPAFTLTYEVGLDDDGQAREIRLESERAETNQAITLKYDGGDAWLLETDAGEPERIGSAGVTDVLIADSMAFFSLAVRASGLHRAPDEISRTALSVDAVDLSVTETPMSFRSDDAMVHGITGETATSAHVDGEGFVLDVPGSTERR